MVSPTQELINLGKISNFSFNFLKKQSADGQLQGVLASLNATQALLGQDILDHKMQSHLQGLNEGFDRRRLELVEMGQNAAKGWMARTWHARKLNALANKLHDEVQSASDNEKLKKDIALRKRTLAAREMGFGQNPDNTMLAVDIAKKQLASFVHELNSLNIPHYSFPSRTHTGKEEVTVELKPDQLVPFALALKSLGPQHSPSYSPSELVEVPDPTYDAEAEEDLEGISIHTTASSFRSAMEDFSEWE
ncbi:hypothetical protein C8F04DRAFT_1398859 [Mycena alexandri]|uniref:Uncharacterized protein n=1 Tax=Mycena alexandri TaxID=1745969 RepID=A0AAD6SKP8_9AGAR|nr:hypothetical protein C8F04DRAFT_1398859 [Mycena alexandri]